MSRRKTISKRRTRFFYAVLFLFLITGSNQPVFLSADDKSSADLKKKDESATAETKETESPEVKREKLRKAADAGDAQAQFYLADSYFFGENLSAPDRTLALYWYKKAAAQGLSQAEFNCGLCYEHGYGVKADIWEAVRFYKLAQDKQYPPAMLNLALIQLYGVPNMTAERNSGKKDDKQRDLSQLFQPENGLALLEKTAAMPGQIEAKTELAEFLLKKIAVADAKKPEEILKDSKRAFQILQEIYSLPQGKTPRACRLLADCYFGGYGTEQNDHQAAILLKQAVEGGDREAMVKLAFFLEQGIDSLPDEKAAFQLYKRAALAGFPYAQYKYAGYIAAGFEQGKGFSEALRWYQAAANSGCPDALHRMGIFLSEGIGTPKNATLSAECFSRAAKAGFAPSQLRLAFLYLNGTEPVKKDESAAFYWVERAAKSGSSEGMKLLALFYHTGTGHEQDEDAAYQLMNFAAEAGDTEAAEWVRKPSAVWTSPTAYKFKN